MPESRGLLGRLVLFCARFASETVEHTAALTRSREGLTDPKADQGLIYCARLTIKITVPSSLYVTYLTTFLPTELARVASVIMLTVLLPSSLLAVYISYLGKTRHLMVGIVVFQLGAVITWCACVWVSTYLPGGVDY